MKMIALLLVTLAAYTSWAQEISGRVLNEVKEPLPDALIFLYQHHNLTGKSIADFDGNYEFKSLDTGKYDLMVIYKGYDSIRLIDVVVRTGQRTISNFMELVNNSGNYGINVKAYKTPIYNKHCIPDQHTPTKEEMQKLPAEHKH